MADRCITADERKIAELKEGTAWINRLQGFKTLHINRPLIECLSDEDCGKLYMALLDYSEYGTVCDFTGNASLEESYVAMIRQIDIEQGRQHGI